mgnify:CR=1 FL=1|uniref:Restriction endonuclease n=1 Tax=Siphoviridae sp. ctVDy27 TaxID=2827881 RepID=A0A8S5S703_9CAUD|nr:MAG TPA: Restriction endonuclease [Siphoviridae sp. ctVDy27]
MARRKSSGCSSDIFVWLIIIGIIGAISDAVAKHWKIILLIAGIILIILLIYFFRKNSDIIESAPVSFRPHIAHGLKLDAGYYNAGHEISAGIYDIKCLKDGGTVKISPDFSVFLDVGEVFKNVRIPSNSILSIPVGMTIDLFNYREMYDLVEEKDEMPEERQMDLLNINTMDGHDFEYFCARVMKRNGFDTAEVTRSSGDHGADIIATRNNVRYAVQCKRWSSAVGNKVVQDVFYAKQVYHCHVGIIITSNTFTPAAREAAKEAGIVLWDGDFLKKYISQNDNSDFLEQAHTNENVFLPQTSEKQSPKSEGGLKMYDAEKGLYPPGKYVTGKTLPLGGYVLKAYKNEEGYVYFYNSMDDMLSEQNELSYHVFDDDYFISVPEEGKYISIDSADVQKVI